MARRVDLLVEVALPADQRDEHHRQAEIGRGPGRIACKDPKAAGIGVHLRPERDLHREIGDAALAQIGL
jgi:hypothetical protein